MNEYQKLICGIRAPQKLERRVLAAAEKQAAPIRRRKTGFVLRPAVCAVLALGLLLGGIALGSAGKEGEVPSALGLTAYASGIGANGGVLVSVDGQEEALDGTVQTLSVTFADGRTVQGAYYLHTEALKTCTNEDGTAVLVPALAGETAETVSGLYAVPEESVWLRWPVEGADTISLSAPYGLRADGAVFHSGIDIPAPVGTGIAAAADGVVTEAGYDTARGNYLVLDHGNGVTTLYAHCSEVLVAAGAKVTAGETVALVGATGMATGPHLHFEVRRDGAAQNPVAYLERSVRDTLKMG
ncbi:MAG: M23 family metallopeptidase [Ruminococcaceae bacterium]|nr:M23 family metallopeptidase [Oscillospiraceae bacterium]